MVTKTRDNRDWSDLAIPPGELLGETLEELGMSQQELAHRIGRPYQAISEIVNGKKEITPDTALELEKTIGVPAHIWTNLETDYRMTLARNREQEQLERQAESLEEFPVSAMERRGWITKHIQTTDRVRAVLEFLGVASFDAWRENRLSVTGFSLADQNEIISPGALAVWLRKGVLDGMNTETAPYDRTRFREAVAYCRTLTREPPEVFPGRMAEECGKGGVAVVFVKEFPKIRAHAVARWLSPAKGLIQLSSRWASRDMFWFNFFHECSHVLRHRVKDVHIHGINGESDDENEANRFAANTLVPPPDWTRFLASDEFTPVTVSEFAGEMEIDPGIVVGRLQHEKRIGYNQLTKLKSRLKWVE